MPKKETPVKTVSKTKSDKPRGNNKKVSSTKNVANSAVKASIKKGKGNALNIVELAGILSGETSLRKRKEKILELKKKAKERQQESLRQGIVYGEVELEENPYYIPEAITATGALPIKIVQKIDLYKWSAPIRVKFPFEMKAFITVVSLSLVFILYLAVLGQYGLMFVIISLLFVLYVAGTTEPENVSHSITTRGVDTLDKLYEWFLLGEFWFSKKNGQHILIIETKLRSPGKLVLIVDSKEIEPIFLLLQEKLLYKDHRKVGYFERISFGEMIRLEDI